MRYWLGTLAMVVTTHCWAQEELPVRCPDQSIIGQAVCMKPEIAGALRAISNSYLEAISKAPSVQVWRDTTGVRLDWQLEYSYCKLKIKVDQAEACLIAAIAKIAPRLPQAPDNAAAELYDRAKVNSNRILSFARDSLSACATRKADALDDGISPARDIAIAVATACRAEIVAVGAVQSDYFTVSLYSSGLSWQGISQLTRQLGEPDNFVEVVLMSRAAKRMPVQKAKQAQRKIGS